MLLVIDPSHGADILSLVDRKTGVDILFQSPWHSRASAICAGQRPASVDPIGVWLEQYRGGWQTLCPNAGIARAIHGAEIGFHGEASVVPWTIAEVHAAAIDLDVELFSVPVMIKRTVTLDKATVTLRDTLSNRSNIALEFDYVSHPALGGPFLEGACRIDTGATRFTSDSESASWIDARREQEWPWVIDSSGKQVDLRDLPRSGEVRSLFGWLHDFSKHWASVENKDLGLKARIEWDGSYLPYAWMWQEFNATDRFPWYRRARVIAIEPASTQTSGKFRHSVLQLSPNGRADVAMSLTLERGRG